MNAAVGLDPDNRLARCEREIAAAIDESRNPHTPTEHLGILLWTGVLSLNRFLVSRQNESQTAGAGA